MQASLWVACALLALLSSQIPPAHSTQVKGSLAYSAGDGKKGFLFFLTRFGVGQGRDMYTYGTVVRTGNQTTAAGPLSFMTLALVPQPVWDAFYAEVPPKNGPSNGQECRTVIHKTLNDSILNRCPDAGGGKQDYLRIVPCNSSSSGSSGSEDACNQPSSVNVLSGQNFTFHVSGAPRSEYYYLFLMACAQDRTNNSTEECPGWQPTDTINIQYDVSLVNALPNGSNPYSNEFPQQLQGTLSLQIAFSLLYLLLIPVHFLLHSRLCVSVRATGRYSMHVLVKIFSVSVVLEAAYVMLEMLHSAIYTGNGRGLVAFKYLGEVANQVSDWLLILVVILVGKGWQVTTSSLRWSKVTMIIWGAYIFFSAIYFVWSIILEQVFPLNLGLYHSYQSWAGALYIVYRLFILIYLLYEMRQVYVIEIRRTALTLYIILAICYVIWFCYLPIITLIALAINPLLRTLFMSAIYLTFDFLINLGMVVLFCPRWSNKFFQFGSYINSLNQPPYMYKSLKAYGTAAVPI